MSRLQDLINELCPDGVEYKPIKDVYKRLKGTPITAGKMKEIQNDDGDIRIFAGGKTVMDAFESDISNANITRVPAVLVQSRGVIDAVYCERPFTFKNEMWAYTHQEKTTVKYLYYVLKNNIEKFREAASGMGSLPQISLKVTEDFTIPISPLPVQREIVRILDNFTELTAELQEKLAAELTARKKQYEYYRDSLLSFEQSDMGRFIGTQLGNLIQKLCPDGVEYKKLGELGKFFGGLTGKSKDDFTNGNAKFVTYKNVYANPALQIDVEDRVKIADSEKQRTLQYGDVVFTGSSETPDECGISSVVTIKTDEKLYLNSFCFFFRFNDLSIILPDFAKHLFRSNDLRYQIGKTASGVTRYNVSKKLMEKVIIPIPPLPVQREIVRILDRFDTLCNDLTGGLPAEIEARQKQYEYYRDKLLQFRIKNV